MDGADLFTRGETSRPPKNVLTIIVNNIILIGRESQQCLTIVQYRRDVELIWSWGWFCEFFRVSTLPFRHWNFLLRGEGGGDA
jgi:hypothetical protein